MKRSGIAGAWLAGVVVLASLYGVSSRDWDGSLQQSTADPASPAGDGSMLPPRSVAIQMPALIAGSAQPLSLTRAMLERAWRSRVLVVGLPDGTQYAVDLEREHTGPGGEWTVVGRVHTRVGPQPMVLTFGPDAVFGILPRPDGFQLQVSTTRGLTTVALAGGLLPPAAPGAPAADPDYVIPPVVADAAINSAGLTNHQSAAAALAEVSSQTEVVVLGLYTGDLVELRGSVSTVETEMVNLFAIANQSHIDSATGVELKLAGLRQATIEPTDNNHVALSAITENQVAGIDLVQLRDSLAADLVALVRPYRDTHGSCGVAWLNGAGRSRYISDAYGFSVTNVLEPCGPHVLAHELGHNMGSAHDVATQTWSGGVEYGAHPFSFGYRQDGPPAFATIMAYTAGQPWLGYFSSPESTRCGTACGVASEADNVRSLRLMAPYIAAFRGPPGSLSLLNVETYEPEAGQFGNLFFRVLLSGVAPAGGVRFDLVVSGGTATQGVDFTSTAMTGITIPEGERQATVSISVIGDAEEEPDETIELRLTNVVGATPHRTAAIGAILNDDPRLTVTGHARFPAGTQPPSTGFDLWVTGADGDFDTILVKLSPPDFAYRLPVVEWANLSMYAEPPFPLVNLPVTVRDIRTSQVRNVMLQQGVEVSGRVEFMPEEPVPTQAIWMNFSANLRGTFQALRHQSLEPPDFRYTHWVVPGAWVYLAVTPPPPYERFLAVHTQVKTDLVQNIGLSRLPTLVVWNSPESNEGPAGSTSQGGAMIELSAPAPPGGVRFRYATADGTATAGSDYTATSGTLELAPGEKSVFIPITWSGDDVVEGNEDFHLLISDVTGANLITPKWTMTLTEKDRHMSTPSPPTRVPGP